MPAAKLRLRGSVTSHTPPWPVGEFPDFVLQEIGTQLVHRRAVGFKDIAGDDFGTIFSIAARGDHLSRPVGITDVVANGVAWSVKTVKKDRPFGTRRVRLISGRNSPDYSHGISNPRSDLAATGRAVLEIWNERVNQALKHHDELRVVVLVRSMLTMSFLLFEQPISVFPVTDFRWQLNKKRNLEGFDKSSDEHCFTWQPHGSQFTIVRRVPGSARRLSIEKQIPTVPIEVVLSQIQFRDTWISVLAPDDDS